MQHATTNLSIVIPQQELSQAQLLQKLKYLETPECRKVMPEDTRVLERAEVTKQFRQALLVNEYFAQFPKVNRSGEFSMDDLYN